MSLHLSVWLRSINNTKEVSHDLSVLQKIVLTLVSLISELLKVVKVIILILGSPADGVIMQYKQYSEELKKAKDNIL